MNNQLTETNYNQNQQTILTKIIITAIIVILSGISIWYFFPTANDPYIEKVLAYDGNLSRGESIFQVNCAGCHGINATGNVGPSLIAISHHKSQSQIIQQVVGGNTPPMPKFQPSTKDMADLLSYLRELS